MKFSWKSGLILFGIIAVGIFVGVYGTNRVEEQKMKKLMEENG